MGKIDVVRLTCTFCRARLVYYPKGMRIHNRSDGVMDYRFFCLNCYEYNQIKFRDERVLSDLTAVGVPVVDEHIPGELFEHPGDSIPPITKAEVDAFTTDLDRYGVLED